MSWGNFLQHPIYGHAPLWAPLAIGWKCKLWQIWSYYIPFEPKFNSEQLLCEHVLVKINHSPVIKPKCEGKWRYLMSNVNSWYTYLQCSVICNNHKRSVLDLLIMKNELDDDGNVMIMIEKIKKISVFYVNFPNNFLNYFPNVSCSSTNYLWFALEYINKMDWDYCLILWWIKKWRTERKSREEENWRNLTRKLHHSPINLLNKICFRWRKSLVIIMKRQYSKYSK